MHFNFSGKFFNASKLALVASSWCYANKFSFYYIKTKTVQCTVLPSNEIPILLCLSTRVVVQALFNLTLSQYSGFETTLNIIPWIYSRLYHQHLPKLCNCPLSLYLQNPPNIALTTFYCHFMFTWVAFILSWVLRGKDYF